MSTIFTGLFSRGSVGIVGFHICHSSSFTIFRFYRGGNLSNVTNYLRFKDKMNSFSVGCPAGWICFFPLLSLFVLRLCLVNTYSKIWMCHAFFFLYSFSKITTLHQQSYINFLLFSFFSFNVDFLFHTKFIFQLPLTSFLSSPPVLVSWKMVQFGWSIIFSINDQRIKLIGSNEKTIHQNKYMSLKSVVIFNTVLNWFNKS